MMILVTGGLGYIGSHFVVSALESGLSVVVIDNLSNSSIQVKSAIEKITNSTFVFEQGDILDKKFLDSVFESHEIESVVHFAGLKAVGESVNYPERYYETNVAGTLNLLQRLVTYRIKQFVFSSSATVYGIPQYLPYDEKHPTAPINPYGQTKLMVEHMMRDLVRAHPSICAIPLRYFNPIGAHDSGLIGENPKDIPNNLMPYIARVAAGELPHLNVFGDDYDTSDGTGERDYIHIDDLIDGHMKTLLYAQKNTGYLPVNLGLGKPVSVLELVNAFEKANHLTIPKKITDRRDGDLPKFWANPERAADVLGWKAKHSINEACSSVWKHYCNTAQSKS